MQETPTDPMVKTELARCVAAHRALKSFAVDVQVTTRGLPQPRGGTVQIALARPGRLRMEAQGPLRAQGTCLLVASNGFIYEASSPKKTYKVTALPIGSDPLEYGLRDDVLLPLPAFTEIMVLRDGLETLMQRLANLRMEREVVLGAPPLRVFHSEHRGTRQTLRFGESDGLLRQVIASRDTVEIREDYRSLRINPRLPESNWRFVPPPGFRDQAEVPG